MFLDISVFIYPNQPYRQEMIQGQFLKWSLKGLNKEFSFS